jgi:hypothetical protein
MKDNDANLPAWIVNALGVGEHFRCGWKRRLHASEAPIGSVAGEERAGRSRRRDVHQGRCDPRKADIIILRCLG